MQNQSTTPGTENQTSGDLYIKIPAEIARRTDLSMAAKMLFGLVRGLCHKQGYCWASNAALAERIGVQPKYLSQLIKELCSKRLLLAAVRQSEGNTRRLYVGPDFHDKDYPPKGGDRQKGDTPTGGEVAPNGAPVRPQAGATPLHPKAARILNSETKEEIKEERTEAASPPAPAARPVFSSSFQEPEKAEEKEPAVVNLPEKPTKDDLRGEIGRCGNQAVRAKVQECWIEAATTRAPVLGLGPVDWMYLRNWAETWVARL